MISLTPEMRDSINNARVSGNPCVVATADRDGTPDLGYIGTMLCLSDSALAYRNRSNNGALVSAEENPKAIVIYRDAAPEWAGSSAAPPPSTGKVPILTR